MQNKIVLCNAEGSVVMKCDVFDVIFDIATQETLLIVTGLVAGFLLPG